MPQCVVFHYDSLETDETTSILAARRNICTIAALATKALVQINITKVVDLLSLDIMIIRNAHWQLITFLISTTAIISLPKINQKPYKTFDGI